MPPTRCHSDLVSAILRLPLAWECRASCRPRHPYLSEKCLLIHAVLKDCQVNKRVFAFLTSLMLLVERMNVTMCRGAPTLDRYDGDKMSIRSVPFGFNP